MYYYNNIYEINKCDNDVNLSLYSGIDCRIIVV